MRSFLLPRKVDNPLNPAEEEEEKEEEEEDDKMESGKELETKKVATDVDPSQDPVYLKTTSVVKSIVELNTGVQMTRPEEFVDLVKVSYQYYLY